jgi:hypothetical protein
MDGVLQGQGFGAGMVVVLSWVQIDQACARGQWEAS